MTKYENTIGKTHKDHRRKFLYVCMQVYEALQDLKAVGVVHGDVHSRNVCFDGEIARVLIYDRPLTNSEMADMFKLLNKKYLGK